MKKVRLHLMALPLSVVVFFTIMISSAKAQTPTYTQEVFNSNIPYNTTTPERRITTTDWTQGIVLGTSTVLNDFEWVNAGSFPTATNQNITGFPAGAGFVRFINRNVAHPGGTAGINYATNGDASFLATRSLDFSGHNVYNAAADTFGISMWRDNTAGALLNVMDYIEVYINTQPNLTGATLLSDKVNGATKIYRSSSQSPPAAAPGAWNRYQYVVPNLANYVSATGGNSNVYILIFGYSAGGNNIYLDNFNMPQWPTPMQVTSAQLYYQSNQNAGKNSTNNLLLGVKINTKGSTNAIKLDGATFSIAGSTNFFNDAQNLSCYFTGGFPAFSYNVANGSVNMPANGMLPPGAIGVNGFGWYAGSCPALATPASMTLNPGTENYIWLSVDIKPTAISGNFVGANFQFAIAGPASTCTFYGNNVSSTNLTTTPIPPQTFGNALQIAQSYIIPTYSDGTSRNGYNGNDYISAVVLVGDNGTWINNYDHDLTCAACLTNSANPNHCSRLACHPLDYTSFSQLTGTSNPYYQKRFVQLTAGYGIRGAGPAYTLKAQAGDWPYNSNNIAVFIDWNNDGDFDDSFNGLGGIINERYGTHTMLNGDLNSYPIAAWPANTTWTINVPDKSDVVTNVGGGGGAIFLGNVRMRLREVYGVNNVDPFSSAYAYGEVEDYTISVLDNCPTPGSTYCKWIGNTSDWNTVSNWCPAVPTSAKDAVIPVLQTPFVYPKIKAGDNVQCHSLKLQDVIGTGAQLTIDAANGASLNVADSIIIGNNAPAGGSTAAIVVNSNYNPTITIPGMSLLPPAGTSLTPQTPFRSTAYQQKTQISYSATELATTYGWKAGDVIDSISIEVASITSSLGASTYPNFRIQAFLISGAPVVYPFPSPLNTKIAVMPGDANVVAGWPKTIYGGTGLPSGTNVTLNMPNATGGTKANGNYYTFVLTPGVFVYDGVSNLVLSFEINTTAGLAPVKNYVLYDESNAAFSTLSLNYNGAAQPNQTLNTGYNLIGYNYYRNAGTGLNTILAGITATVSNQRPRLDFSISRTYQTFPINIGGTWSNYNSAGNGLIAGNSTVNFINSASAAITGKVTTFNKLVVNKATNSNKVMLKTNITVDSLLTLTKGKLMLNQKVLTVNNSNASAITKVSGGIVSESTVAPYGYVNWNIDANLTAHYIPFTTVTNNAIPFVYRQMTGNAGYVKVATYPTAVNNLPYPTGVTNINDTNGVNNQNYTADRFWMLSRTGTTGNAQLRFNYMNTEAPAPIAMNNLEVNRFDVGSNKWQRFTSLVQTNGAGVTVSNIVINNVPAIYLNSAAAWALSDNTSPLRVASATEPVALIYPNPFTDFVKVVSDESVNTVIEYVIYDATMRVVSKGKLAAGEQFINTQNLTSGTYLIQLNTGNTTQQKKMVKL